MQPAIYKLSESPINGNLVRDWKHVFGNGWQTGWPDHRFNKIISINENQHEFIAIGQQRNVVVDIETDPQIQRGFMVKFTDDGDSLWTREYEYLTEGWRQHQLNDIIEAPDGGYYLCGMINDYRDTFGLEPPYHRGWLMKVDKHGCLIPGCEQISSIKERSKIIDIKLYPNPADDFINFQVVGFSPNLNFNCRIVDLQGKILKTFNRLNSNVTYFYPIDDLPNGVYILQILNKNGIVASEKIIVN